MNDVEHGRSLTCTAAKYSAVKSQVIYKLKHPGDRMIKILAAHFPIPGETIVW